MNWGLAKPLGLWASGSLAPNRSSSISLEVKHGDECLDMSSKRCSFNMSTWTLGGMPDTLVIAECLEKNSKGTLAQRYIPKAIASPRFSIVFCTYKFQDRNSSCFRYTGGRTKGCQIPGSKNFSVMIVFRINSVPQKCGLLSLRTPCHVFKWICGLMDWYKMMKSVFFFIHLVVYISGLI